MAALNKRLLILGLFYFIINGIQGQVIGKLALLPDGVTYRLSLIPNQTIAPPNNITNTGQITLKAAAGSLEMTDFQNITGHWELSTIIEQPSEAPNYDYFIINLITPIINPEYIANQELAMFSFKNAKTCSGSIELIENEIDAFWPPNSFSLNIGNQLAILQFGVNNAYHENDFEFSKTECPNDLTFQIDLDSIKCATQKGQLKLHFMGGKFPIRFHIQLEEEIILTEEVAVYGDFEPIELDKGDYILTVFDEKDTITEIMSLVEPAPLQINVLELEKPSCADLDGTRVRLGGQGGGALSTYQFDWSHGKVGAIMENLSPGAYQITMTDQYACQATYELEIKAPLNIEIDTILRQSPTCHNGRDGSIELPLIKNATAPVTYALNGGVFQKDNYFDDLPAGTYSIKIKDGKNCQTEQLIELENPAILEISTKQADTLLIKGQSMMLQPEIRAASELTYSWEPSLFLSCQDCPNPIAKPSQTTTFSLLVNNEWGCEAYFEQHIKVLPDQPIYIPTAFSPNGDGQNDLFEIHIGATIEKVKNLKIFNRWGQMIFDANATNADTSISWDGQHRGKSVETGVYIYFAEILLKNGDTKIQKGDFFLIK
jgi:gliding motility-associated-like protein